MFVPDSHKFESSDPKLLPRELPADKVYPVEGVILQIIDGGEQVLLITWFPTDVFVKHTCVFVHAVAGIVKLACGFAETYIGTTPTEEVLQGLVATILAENEFAYVLLPSELLILHDEVKNVCVTEEGGGWLKVTGVEPSLNVTM